MQKMPFRSQLDHQQQRAGRCSWSRFCGGGAPLPHLARPPDLLPQQHSSRQRITLRITARHEKRMSAFNVAARRAGQQRLERPGYEPRITLGEFPPASSSQQNAPLAFSNTTHPPPLTLPFAPPCA